MQPTKNIFILFHRMCEWRSLFSITTDTSRRVRSAPCRSRWRTSRCWRRRRRRSPRSPTSSPSKNRLVQAFYKAHPSTVISRPFRWIVQVPQSSKSLVSLDQFGQLFQKNTHCTSEYLFFLKKCVLNKQETINNLYISHLFTVQNPPQDDHRSKH